MNYNKNETIVEAIDEGHIVKVTEYYAKREGLPIIRRPKIEPEEIKEDNNLKTNFKDNPRILNNMKNNIDWREKQVLNELLDNFHWKIRVERRHKRLTRKQLSKLIEEPEEKIQELENGRLPSKDFILINKVQQALGINLRKDKKDFSKTLQEMMPHDTRTYKPKKKENIIENEIAGSEIEILESEI